MITPPGTGLPDLFYPVSNGTKSGPLGLKATTSVLFHSVWVIYSKFLDASTSSGEESHPRTSAFEFIAII